jgi:hypothetical protein
MATIEARIEKLEKLTPTGVGRITAIQHLIIEPINKRCVRAFRTPIPSGERTEIIGAEFEAIKRDNEAK